MSIRPDGPASRAAEVRVWDPLVRTSHWLVALGCLVNLTFLKHADEPHEWVGYAVLAAVVVRILWGLVAPGHANFRDFLPSPRAFIAYVGLAARHREPRYLGHNPAGAAMMVSLMVLVLACGITGWMLGQDAFWGDSMIHGVHEASANAILVLALVHVAGAVLASVRHRENLVFAMLTGRKRAPSGSDVSRIENRPRNDG